MEFDLSKLSIIAKQHHLHFLILFGSYAASTQTKDSDLDLAFLPQKRLTIDQENNLFNDVISALEFSNVDLINLGTNHNTALKNEIFQNGKIIFETKKGLVNELKWDAWIDYQDFKRDSPDIVALLTKKIEAL